MRWALSCPSYFAGVNLRLQYCERKPRQAQKNPGVGKMSWDFRAATVGGVHRAKVSGKLLLGGTESTGDLKKVPLRPFAGIFSTCMWRNFLGWRMNEPLKKNKQKFLQSSRKTWNSCYFHRTRVRSLVNIKKKKIPLKLQNSQALESNIYPKTKKDSS